MTEPAYKRKERELAESRRAAQRHDENAALVSALAAMSAEIKAGNHKSEPRRLWINLRDTLGVAGVWFAAFVAIWAIRTASGDSEGQRKVMANQLKAMQSQLNAMATDLRPWVKVEGTIDRWPFFLDFSRPNIALPIPFHAKLTNTGKSPAFNARVSVSAYVQPAPPSGSSYIQERRRVCDMLMKEPLDDRDNGYVLFPNESKVDRDGTSANEVAPGMSVAGGSVPGISQSDLESLPKDEKKFSIYIVGCVDYVSALDHTHHQSSIAYIVGWSPPDDKPEVRRILLFNKNDKVPIDQLRLYSVGSDEGTN